MNDVHLTRSGKGKTSVVYCDCCGEAYMEHQIDMSRDCPKCENGKVVKESREV